MKRVRNFINPMLLNPMKNTILVYKYLYSLMRVYLLSPLYASLKSVKKCYINIINCIYHYIILLNVLAYKNSYLCSKINTFELLANST